MIGDVLNPMIGELFIRDWKLNISLSLITESYFAVPKTIRLNYMHYFIMRITNKRELQQIDLNHSWDIDFENFMNICKNCTSKPNLFFMIDCTLASDNLLRFRKDLLERI